MTVKSMALGVNIDHVATLRQARRARYARAGAGGAGWPNSPVPTTSRCTCARTGGTSRPRDVQLLSELLKTRMNLEMAVTRRDAAHLPAHCGRQTAAWCRSGVPNSPPRADWMWWPAAHALRERCARLTQAGIRVALFIDPDEPPDRGRGRRPGAGHRAAHRRATPRRRALRRRASSSVCSARRASPRSRRPRPCTPATACNYQNVQPVAALPEIVELNIGHAIIARALFVGLARAVREMKALMLAARA